MDTSCKNRYVDKCTKIGMNDTDPYSIPTAMTTDLSAQTLITLTNGSIGSDTVADSFLKEIVPDVAYADIFHYLVHTTSYYTGKQLKGYKSLEAYDKLFAAGWVHNVCLWKIYTTSNLIVYSKVGLLLGLRIVKIKFNTCRLY